MTLRSHCALAALSLLATAALAVTSADARPGQGRGYRSQPSVPVVETLLQVEAPSITVEAPTAEISTDSSVEPSIASLVVNGSVVDQPTADRQNLPPGLQRQADSGRGLPPGLQRG